MKPLSFSGFYTQLLICVHNCDDHSLLDFKSAVQHMKHFIYHFIKWLRRPVANSANAILPYLVHFISSSHSLSKNLIQIINFILITVWSKWFSVKQRRTTDSVGVITRFAITRNVSQIILRLNDSRKCKRVVCDHRKYLGLKYTILIQIKKTVRKHRWKHVKLSNATQVIKLPCLMLTTIQEALIHQWARLIRFIKMPLSILCRLKNSFKVRRADPETWY